MRSIESFSAPTQNAASAGEATGFTLTEQIYVARGELATLAREPHPSVTTRLRASLFWLGKQPLVPKRDYLLKLGTGRVPMRVEQVHRVVNAASLEADEGKARVDRHEVAEVTLKLQRAMAFDLADDLPSTGRFVVVEDFEIRGGGIVREALPDTQSVIRDKVLLRNYKWEPSHISPDRRAERYRQRPTLLLITGATGADRKHLARDIEARLFEMGNVVYFLGIGNVLYGVDADIDRKAENRAEHVRRLAEVANLMLDAGVILIATAAELTQEDLELVRTTVESDRIETIWLGDEITTDISWDLQIADPDAPEAAEQVKRLLQERGIIFRPW